MVAGHVCIDVVPDLSQLRAGFSTFCPGQLIEVGTATLSVGGAVSNTGVALHRLGVPVRLVGKVGNDVFGTMVRELLGKSIDLNGIEHSATEVNLIVDPVGATSYSIVLNPADVDRIFLHCPGANDTFAAVDVQASMWEGIGVFHFGYPPLMRNMYVNDGDELVRLFQTAKQYEVVTSLDMAMPDSNGLSGQVPWSVVLANVLPSVDMFWMSLDEARFLYNQNREAFDIEKASDKSSLPDSTVDDIDIIEVVSHQCLHLGAKFVGIKLGDAGLYIRTRDMGNACRLQCSNMVDPYCEQPPSEQWNHRELYTPCYKVTVQGTTGAGDTTIAGFLAAMVSGQSIEECLSFAVGVGASSVEGADAVNGIGPFASVQSRIRQGWDKSYCTLLWMTNWKHEGEIYFGNRDVRRKS